MEWGTSNAPLLEAQGAAEGSSKADKSRDILDQIRFCRAVGLHVGSVWELD